MNSNRTTLLSLKKLLLCLAMTLGGAHVVSAQITITSTSWNVIGLDSNRTSDGPDLFPVGARVCNTSGAAINNVIVTFVWDSSNTYINLEAGDTINVGTLAAGTCRDYYFLVRVTRNSSAYNATRRYHITVSGDGAATVSTPTPRELYVERLVSQNRNSINSISGPTTVYVGSSYTFTLNADTATNGYEQLEAFLPFSASIFEVTSISTTYTAPSGGTNTKFYADACGWDNNPTSGTYRSCIGPNQYSGGKAGGTISTTYTVRVISAGTSSFSALVYDFSGSSYHYNSDFGTQIHSVTALNPPDMTIAKSHTGNFTQGQTGATYQLMATNSGGAPTSGTVTVTDTLPTGLTPTGATGTSWTCNISSQTMTCTCSDVLAASASYPAITLTVNVSSSAAASITNQATVAGGNETNTTNNSASDPATINPGPPIITLIKTVTPVGEQQPNTDLSYTITFTNSGSGAAQQLVLVDAIPANTDFKVSSAIMDLGTTGLAAVIEYSNDYNSATPAAATWTYTPSSGGGGAASGYDSNVRAVRWHVTAGTLTSIAPNNTGNIGFTVSIR